MNLHQAGLTLLQEISILLEGIPAPVEEVASPSDIQSVLPVPENGTVEHKPAERQAQPEADQTKAPQTSPLLRLFIAGSLISPIQYAASRGVSG